MKKALWAAAGLVALVVVLVLTLVTDGGKQAGVPLALPDGSSVIVSTVTFGTNHIYGTALSRVIVKLPPVAQNLAKKLLGRNFSPPRTTVTPQPSLVLWLVTTTNNSTQANAGYYSVFLSDASGFISGPQSSYNVPAGAASSPMALTFAAWPRRDKQIQAEFFYHDPDGGVRHAGRIAFSNPTAGQYPQWQPLPLPARSENGDIAAVLEEFCTGFDDQTTVKSTSWGTNIVTRGTNRIDGHNHSLMRLRFVSPRAEEEWQVVGVETSDATGNSIDNQSSSWSDHWAFSYTPALWPGENAWKLRVEAKRKAGFLPEERIVFKDIPLGDVGETNRISWTTNAAGLILTLDEVCHRAPAREGDWSSRDLSSIKLRHSALPEGTRLDLVEVIYSTGKTNTNTGWSSDGHSRTYWYRFFPAGAKTADLVLAVQRSRYFEFMVEPKLP